MKIPLEQHPFRPHRPRPASTPGARLLRRLALCTTLSVIGLPIVTTTAAQAETAPVPLVTQIADEPVSVSAAQFRRDLFAAADAARLSDPGNTADLLAERVLQHVYALDPQADPAAAATAVRGLVAAATSVTGRAFDARITRTMVLFQGAATDDGGPLAATLQRATTEVVALTAQDVTAVAADTHAENALGTTGDTESRLLASPTFTPTQVLRDSATLADRSAGFASARDLVWASATGASVSASSEVLLSTAPALVGNADVQALAALRDRVGDLQTTGRVIAGTPGGSAAPHTIESVMAELSLAVDTTRQVAADSTGTGQVDPGVGSGAVEDARDAQTTLALQTGFLTGGTSAAKDIVDQVGAAAVQATLLAMAFDDFSAGNLSRAALSGNAIGVVMTLLPGVLDAAGVFGPSVDDLVMTQLDNISQQLADFQNAVDGQFAQVFENLGGVSDQVTDISRRLDRAVIDIQQARVQIGQVYDSLTQLQGSLDAVQNNLLEALRNGTNSQLRQTINSALGYQDRNGSPLPLNDFNNAAAYLHTFATVTARHSPELNTDHPSFDLQDDANQLSTGIASNVDFLDQLPSKRGWAAARLSRTTGDEPQLANLDDFVLASRAYAQLMLENPRYVSTGYRRWLSDIQALGGPLATLTSAISTPDTTTGTRSTLINHLVCARTAAAFTPTTTPACQEQTEDTTPVDQLVDQAVRELAGTLPGYDGAGNETPSSRLSTTSIDTTGTRVSDHRFDPFVDAATDTSDLSLLWPGLDGRKKVQQCGAVDGETAAGPRLGEMDRPTSLTPASQGVPEVFSWAGRMGLGKLDVCWRSTPRTMNVDSCLITDLMVVNRLSASECGDTYLRSGLTRVFGTATQVQYRYDDTAFVWTFTPQKPASPTIYVQSLVRHGAGDTSAVVGRSTIRNLPGGGYLQSGTTATFISDVQLTGGTDGDYTLESSPRTPAVMYGAPADVAAVARRWGNATTSTPATATSSVASYQAAANGVVARGSALDQAVPGLDPKLGTATAKYARTCTPSDAPASCVSGTGTGSIVSTTTATQAADDTIDATLVGLQGSIYRKLLSGTQTQGSTTSGPLHDALVRVDGANAMLSSYLQLGAGAALRQHDLTSLPGSLLGSKAVISAMKAQVAATSAGRTAAAPGRLVTAVLDPGALTALDGLLPLPSSASGRTAAAVGRQVAGPVQPALLATNDQLTLTAIALGAPPSPTPPSSTPTTTPTPAAGVPSAPVPAVRVVLGRAPARKAELKGAYRSRVVATGGAGTYRWTRQGRLPLGMTGRATRSGSAYVLKGWPQKTGTYTFSLTATDVSGASTTRSYRIRVR